MILSYLTKMYHLNCITISFKMFRINMTLFRNVNNLFSIVIINKMHAMNKLSAIYLLYFNVSVKNK